MTQPPSPVAIDIAGMLSVSPASARPFLKQALLWNAGIDPLPLTEAAIDERLAEWFGAYVSSLAANWHGELNRRASALSPGAAFDLVAVAKAAGAMQTKLKAAKAAESKAQEAKSQKERRSRRE